MIGLFRQALVTMVVFYAGGGSSGHRDLDGTGGGAGGGGNRHANARGSGGGGGGGYGGPGNGARGIVILRYPT